MDEYADLLGVCCLVAYSAKRFSLIIQLAYFWMTWTRPLVPCPISPTDWFVWTHFDRYGFGSFWTSLKVTFSKDFLVLLMPVKSDTSALCRQSVHLYQRCPEIKTLKSPVGVSMIRWCWPRPALVMGMFDEFTAPPAPWGDDGSFLHRSRCELWLLFWHVLDSLAYSWLMNVNGGCTDG